MQTNVFVGRGCRPRIIPRPPTPAVTKPDVADGIVVKPVPRVLPPDDKKGSAARYRQSLIAKGLIKPT